MVDERGRDEKSNMKMLEEGWKMKCDCRTCRCRRGIFDAMKKFHRKIPSHASLLIGCHSIPLQSDRDHDLFALLGTHGFECECLLFPADDELYDPSCNINRGFGGTQEWPPKNEQYLITDIHLEYQMDICLGGGNRSCLVLW
jgi:hypothetical protein